MRFWIVLCALAPGVAAAQAAAPLESSWSVEERAAGPVEDTDAVADLEAARAHLEQQIRPRDPTRYVLLDPELSRLEGMNEIADGLIWTTMGTTAATLALAIGLAVDQRKDSSAVLFALSGGVLVVGLLVQALFRPSADDVLDVFRVRR